MPGRIPRKRRENACDKKNSKYHDARSCADDTTRAATFPGVVDAHKAVVGIIYVAAYVALDWVSFIEPYEHFDITPWNPNTGLSFILILVFGRRMMPFLFISPLVADLVNRELVGPWIVELISAGLIAGGYSAALIFLTRPNTRFDPALSSMRDLVLLILVVAASAAFVASGYVGVRVVADLLPAKDFATATLRYWIGDMIGVLGLAPFALFALTRRRILPLMSIETGLQCVAIIGALVIVFLFAEEREFQLFYVLFLPIVWMAVRNGTEGVSVGILITQLGVILGVRALPCSTRRVDCLSGPDARSNDDWIDRGRVGCRTTSCRVSTALASRVAGAGITNSVASANWPRRLHMKLISL